MITCNTHKKDKKGPLGHLVRAAIVLLLLFVSFPVAQAVDAPVFVSDECYATAGGAVHLEWTGTADTFTLYYHTAESFAEATMGPVTAATSVTFTPSLTNQNLYFWVEATEGEDTAESASIQRFVDSQAPTVPSLTSPDTGSAYVNGTVDLAWNASTDNQPSGNRYYQVSYQKQGASEMFSPENIASKDPTTTRELTSLTSGTYTWKVRAMDEAGNISDWSSTRTFYVNTGNVVLTSPADNSVLSVPSGTYVQYSWQPVTGFTYAFNLYQGATQIFDQESASEATYTPSTHTYVEGETYQWNVQLYDGSSYGTTSSTWTFTIDNTPPGVPTIIGPSGGDTITDSTPTLSWNAVADASTYDVQVSTSSTFATTAYTVSGLSETSHTIPAGSALANATYYWRVQAVDAAANVSGWSATASFVVNVPAAPVLQAPANGSTTTDTTPTFTWGAVTGVDDYILQYSTSESFTSPTSVTVGTTTYTPPSAMALGTYYWRVKATLTSGGETAYSTAWSLILTSTPNQPPVAFVWPVTVTVYPGQSVTLDSDGSYDPDGTIVAVAWRDDEGTLLGSGPTYATGTLPLGSHVFTLEVTDNKGATGTAFATVRVVLPQTTTPGMNPPTTTPAPSDGDSPLSVSLQKSYVLEAGDMLYAVPLVRYEGSESLTYTWMIRTVADDWETLLSSQVVHGAERLIIRLEPGKYVVTFHVYGAGLHEIAETRVIVRDASGGGSTTPPPTTAPSSPQPTTPAPTVAPTQPPSTTLPPTTPPATSAPPTPAPTVQPGTLERVMDSVTGFLSENGVMALLLFIGGLAVGMLVTGRKK